MSHLRRAEGYEQEQTSSEDDSAARNLHSKKRRLMETDEHIGSMADWILNIFNVLTMI